jgi:serine/threonine-protein kinase RsbW
MEQTFQYPSNIQEIPHIRKDLEFLKHEWAVPKSETRQIRVIIEELFSNIIRYAYKDSHEHMIEVRLTNSDSQIEIEILDDGTPFNPLEYQLTPVADPANSDAGGMGLTLIRAFASTISYHRSAQKNHMIITKKVKNRLA